MLTYFSDLFHNITISFNIVSINFAQASRVGACGKFQSTYVTKVSRSSNQNINVLMYIIPISFLIYYLFHQVIGSTGPQVTIILGRKGRGRYSETRYTPATGWETSSNWTYEPHNPEAVGKLKIKGNTFFLCKTMDIHQKARAHLMQW